MVIILYSRFICGKPLQNQRACQTTRNEITILTSTLIIYLINVYTREVLTLFDVVSQRLVYGFWALILLGNQISNWNHVTGRTDPQPAEPISSYSVFLFRLASLLCLFIYLSIYPYLSPTLRDHHRPSEQAWIRLHTYIGCDATLATPPSWQRGAPPLPTRGLSLTHTVQLRVSLG